MTQASTAHHGHEESRKLLILLCVSIPSFMLNIDANVVAVSLPSIARSLNADFAAIEWVVSAYTLTFASLVLPAGMLADRYGRKNILIVGLILFTAASFVCGAAPNVPVLNAARALQGVGAALLLSAALAILSHEFRGAERARAFAFWGSVIGIGIALGPVAGGLITENFGWEWAFYVNVPLGVGITCLTMFAVKESRNPNAATVDIPGFITFAGALFLLTFALISGNHAGWASREVTFEFAGSAILFIVFLVVETNHPHPMLDLGFFRRPTYVGANIAGLAYAATLLTMLTYLPLYFQGGLGFAAQRSGLMMLPIAVPLFIVPRLVARYLTHRLAGRSLLTIGLGLVAVGLVWLAFNATKFNYSTMLVGMLIAGTGAGILNGETAKVSMTAIPPERAGMAAGVGGAIRFSGIVIGFAALGAVLFHGVTANLRTRLPDISTQDLVAIAQRIVAGDLPGAAVVRTGLGGIPAESFGAGYRVLFFVAAAVAIASAIASWSLVRAADTAPIKRDLKKGEPVAIPID